MITANDVERIGEDFRQTIRVLCGEGTERHSTPFAISTYRDQKVWEQIVRLLDIYADHARAVGVEPELELGDLGGEEG